MTFKYKVGNIIREKSGTFRQYRIDWEKKCRSKFQKRVKDYLYHFWRNHIVFEEFPVPGTRSTLDLYNATLRVAVECQGRQHNEFIPFFHGGGAAGFRGGFGAQVKRDMGKHEWCELNEITLVEIFEEDVLNYHFAEEHGLI